MKIKQMQYDNKGTKAYRFFCPGCQEHHAPTVPGWQFNGNFESPTFHPSILVTSGHYAEGHKGDCWCIYNAKHPDNLSSFKCYRCHSYVTDGKIQFLSDCTHALAGQTVELPELKI